MKKQKEISGIVSKTVFVSILVCVATIKAGFFSANWWNKNVVQPVQKEVIKPTEQACVSACQAVNKNVIQPIDVNVVKPTIGVGETVVNIVDMAILIKNMIPPIQQVIENITSHVTTISKIKNGKDVVDPIFGTFQELTKLPPHFQAILDKIAYSLSAIEAIVRPSSATDANKIKDAAVEIRSISKSVDEITRKIVQLNTVLHNRVKSIAESATHATNAILTIIK